MVDNDNTQNSCAFQSILVFTFRFAQKAAVIFKIHVSGISTRQIVYSSYLESKLYQAWNPWQMHNDWNIECWDAKNVYTHTWMAYHLFHNLYLRQCHLVVQEAFQSEVAFQAEVLPVVVEVCRSLCASRVCADISLYYFRREDSHLCDCYKPLPGVFPLPPSPFYAQETKLLTLSLLGLEREVF